MFTMFAVSWLLVTPHHHHHPAFQHQQSVAAVVRVKISSHYTVLIFTIRTAAAMLLVLASLAGLLTSTAGARLGQACSSHADCAEVSLVKEGG